MVGKLFHMPSFVDVVMMFGCTALASFLYKLSLSKNTNDKLSTAYKTAMKFRDIHHPQRCDWDCGVACARMVQQWSATASEAEILCDNVDGGNCFNKGRPLWTIELFVALHCLGCNVSMFTLSLGVSKHHQLYDWYKVGIEEDTVLVEQALAFVNAKSLNIANQNVSLSKLRDYLSNPMEIIAIILVDSNLLTLRETGIEQSLQDFKGHYILLLSHDKLDDTFLYLDPADDSKDISILRIAAERLEQARKHPGTDEDIIFCHRSNMVMH